MITDSTVMMVHNINLVFNVSIKSWFLFNPDKRNEYKEWAGCFFFFF